MMILISKKVRR